MEQSTKRFRKRDAILECVRSTTSHPSADWVFARLKPVLPDISLATVYRNLSLFKQQGVIASVGTVRGVERFDGNTEPHVHFICHQCDAIIDLPQMQVPQSLSSQAAAEAGGQVDVCQLTFTGICNRCCSKN
ncbi:MAG: transcriptional repressor [Ruminococcaceae bacterium]|nr:transcriptional repressor [Oscillospiraceae bacterium]